MLEHRLAGQLVCARERGRQYWGGCSTSSHLVRSRAVGHETAGMVEEIASEKWDFVAIQAVDINTITEPVVRMIAAGIPVIDMDTLIAPLDQIDVLTFLAPDNDFMGAAVTQALVDAIGGEGTIIMTQGALGHTGAQGRARGFQSVIDRFPGVAVLATDPADWDVAKTAQLWRRTSTRSRRSMPRSSTTTTWRSPRPTS